MYFQLSIPRIRMEMLAPLLGSIPDMETDAALDALNALKKHLTWTRHMADHESKRSIKMLGELCP